MNKTSAMVAALAAVAFTADAATISRLGVPSASWCRPAAISPVGTFVGGCMPDTAATSKAFLSNPVRWGTRFLNPSFTAFGPPENTRALDVTSAGILVGFYRSNGPREWYWDTAPEAFAWDPSVSHEAVPLPPVGVESIALGVSEEGLVVGSVRGQAALWKPDGSGGYVYVDRGALLGAGNDSEAFAINSFRQIVGRRGVPPILPGGWGRAFRINGDGTVTDLHPAWSPSPESAATAINERGEAVGVAGNTLVGYHGVVWNAAGSSLDLNIACHAAIPTCQVAIPEAINDSSHVVGRYADSRLGTRAFFFDGRKFYDLTRLLGSTTWTLIEASSIDANDEIVGAGTPAAGRPEEGFFAKLR